MRSNRDRRTRSFRLGDQQGLGLVEVLVASAILGVSLAVMLTNMSTMVVGARVADRRTGEERLVRNRIEVLLAQPIPPPGTCASSTTTSETVDPTLPTKTTYTVTVVADCSTPHYLAYKVTAKDPSGGTVSLSVGRFKP